MLKHVQVSPHRNRADSVSLRSSTSCASSLCGSPEPPSDSLRPSSRASSYCSLSETAPQTTMKVYTACLRLDIEYKTLGIQWDTTSKDVVQQILRRCKMRQKDPRLFYLTMEVTVRKAGVKTVLALDDEARPAILQACHPKGDSRFCLQTKPGGLIRVHTSTLEPTSLYKSLFISEETTSDELLTLLLTCFNSHDPVEQYSLYEVCSAQEYQRKLHPDDLPLRAQQQRIQRGEQCHFIVRKNPHFARRILAAVSETKVTPLIAAPLTESNLAALDEQMSELRLNKSTGCSHSSPKPIETNANNRRYVSVYLGDRTAMCKKCRNNFRSCDFCSKSCSRRLSGSRLARIPTNSNLTENVTADNEVINRLTYNPVYNIREIRTVCNSFSSLAGDKNELDNSLPQSALKRPSINNVTDGTTNTSVVREVVNNNPAKGYGNFVYI